MMNMSTKETKDIGEKDIRHTVPDGEEVPEHNRHDQATADLFRKLWVKVTDDNGLTLHGFRRFKTSHLLNLRFLEEEIAKLDRQVYQAGLKLGIDESTAHKLGLQHAKRDADALHADQVMDQRLVLRLRELIKQYGKLIASQFRVVCIRHTDRPMETRVW